MTEHRTNAGGSSGSSIKAREVDSRNRWWLLLLLAAICAPFCQVVSGASEVVGFAIEISYSKSFMRTREAL
jgi:hypothetical protein